MRMVISQPMFFPWAGIFEQAKLADIFVHYDDVQIPLGRSFVSRVQIKSPEGIKWLTIPIERDGKQMIKDVRIDQTQNWRDRHLKTLRHYYSKASYVEEMMGLVERVYSKKIFFLAEVNIFAMEEMCQYFGLSPKFHLSSEYSVNKSSSEKLLEIVKQSSCDVYITGHGAKNYLDHELFDKHGVQVQYMRYKRIPYPQIHEPFDFHVSTLDLIANMGSAGKAILQSDCMSWKEFIYGSDQAV